MKEIEYKEDLILREIKEGGPFVLIHNGRRTTIQLERAKDHMYCLHCFFWNIKGDGLCGLVLDNSCIKEDKIMEYREVK